MEPVPVFIYPAFPEHLQVLRELSISTFKESFADVNTKADMDKYIAGTFNESNLSDELVAPGVAYFLLYLKDNPIGYMKLISGTVPQSGGKEGVEIERIYVKKAHQGKAYGQQLFLKAVNVALSLGAKIIWLGVWEKNPGAIKFYKRNGFTEFGKHIFTLGTDKQTDLLMKREV